MILFIIKGGNLKEFLKKLKTLKTSCTEVKICFGNQKEFVRNFFLVLNYPFLHVNRCL